MEKQIAIPVIEAYDLGIYDELVEHGAIWSQGYHTKAFQAFATIEERSSTILIDADTPFGISLLMRFPELSVR